MALPDPGKAFSSHPIRDWPDDADADDDDDCSIIEVYDPIPFSFTFPLDTMSADPAGQVIQNAPLRQEQGAVPARRRRRTPSTSAPAPPAARDVAPPANPPKARKKSAPIRKHGSRRGPPKMPTGPLAGEEPEPM